MQWHGRITFISKAVAQPAQPRAIIKDPGRRGRFGAMLCSTVLGFSGAARPTLPGRSVNFRGKALMSNDDEITGMYEVLDAVETVIKAADPAKREALYSVLP
jgi:hypothetical protein